MQSLRGSLCSHAFPPLSSCSHCVCAWARKKVRAVARLMRKGEMERKPDRSVSVMENENPSRLFHNSKEQEWWRTFYAFVPFPLRYTWKTRQGWNLWWFEAQLLISPYRPPPCTLENLLKFSLETSDLSVWQNGRKKSIMDAILALLPVNTGGFLGCSPFTEIFGFHFLNPILHLSKILW